MSDLSDIINKSSNCSREKDDVFSSLARAELIRNPSSRYTLAIFEHDGQEYALVLNKSQTIIGYVKHLDEFNKDSIHRFAQDDAYFCIEPFTRSS